VASSGFRDWIAAGSPYTLIPPARALQRTLRARGFTVWDYPDYAHQIDEPPEDHTPYSVTGWPGTNARWNARALDIMPKGSTAAARASWAARHELANLARRIIADKTAGRPGTEWIKYLNWTDEGGVCRQERWTPSHETRSSTDREHIHISGRSDADLNVKWTVAAALYDPTGDSMTITDDDVRRVAQGVWELFRAPVGPDGTAYNMQDHVIKTEHGVAAQGERLAALETSVAEIKTMLEAAGGSADVAAFTVVLNRALAELREHVGQDTSKVVSAFGDGGADAAAAALQPTS